MKKRLTVLALAFAMVLTMSASVFATPTSNVDEAQGAKQNNEHKFQITKQLDIAEGITVPTKTFTFTATPGDSKYANDDAYASDTDNYPALFGTGNTDSVTYTANSRAAGSSDVELVELGKVVDLDAINWPHAGLFVYKVTENQPSETSNTETVNDGTLTYDTGNYFVKVYIKNADSTHEKPWVQDVQITNGSEKIDVKPGDDDPNADKDSDGDLTNDGNAFRFTNTYTKEVTTHPTDSDNDTAGAFKLSKTVAGAYGDKTKDFKYDIVVTYPKTATAPASAPALVSDYSKAVKTGTVSEKTVTYTGVELADSKNVKIATLPVGTTIKITESATLNYTPSVNAKGGKAGTEDYSIAKNEANKSKGLEVAKLVVGENGAFAEYTNTVEDSDVTPTGIIINNLPYVLLIGLALGGIVLFSRKRRYE